MAQRRCRFFVPVASLLAVAAAATEELQEAAEAALLQDDECAEADSDECSLSALQLRWQRLAGAPKEPACGRCLRSCLPGEDAAFRGNASFTDCAQGCGCPRPPPENLINGSIFGEDRHEGLVGAAGDTSWGYWLWRLYGLRQQIGALEGYGATASEYYSSLSFKRGGAAYSTVQTMSHDRNLYDPVLHVWTAEKYLEDVRKRFGGVDQVLIWPSYPNIGADSRSNMDMLEAMPGGLAACVKALKAAQPSLLVQIAFMPWDIFTNGTHGTTSADELAELARYVALMKDGGVDGINLDTMTSLKVGFDGPTMADVVLSDVAKRAGMEPLIIEPELGPYGGLTFLNVTLQGWLYQLAQCPPDFCTERVPFKPLVSLQKWLVRGSMPHVCGRWSTQRSQEILTAYFNAVGFTPWENIWGLWNGVNDFDGELWKRAQAILKHLHPVLVDNGTAWLPFYPLRNETLAGSHVFASKFAGRDLEVWLLINTGMEDAGAVDWALPVPTSGPSSLFFDLYRGNALHAEHAAGCLVKSCEGKSGRFTELVRVPVEAHGIGAVLRIPSGKVLPEEHEAFMKAMKAMSAQPLSSFSNGRVPIPQQHLVQPALAAVASSTSPQDAVLVRGSSEYEFRVFGAEIEDWWWAVGQPGGADVQYPWEALPTKYHSAHTLSISDLWVDKHPVTNDEFSAFLQETAYKPGDTQNFLRHWGGPGCRGASTCTMPPSVAREPVVFVGLEDARAYCAHRGRRLPHEWEWQYVAQAGDPQKLYPWGSEWRPDLMPIAQPNASMAKMTDVGQHPGGATKDGVEDLVGLIWHWTDEYADEHTRAAVLRGGPAFQAGFSGNENPRYQPWYFPGHAMDGIWDRWDGRPRSVAPKKFANLYRLTVHGKYLLMAPSLDRAGTIGFRCVADADPHDIRSG